MKKLALCIPILLVITTLVHAESLYDYETLDVELTESSQITIIPKESSYYVDYIRAYLYLYPKADKQYKITGQTAKPEAEETESALLYLWREPDNAKLEFSLKSELSSSSNTPIIKEKIPFPMQFPATLDIYTRATAHIDSNNEKIKAKASEIAEGEDDLFILLFKLGSWVEQNVEYDLSTLTADVSQKASWVLENRVGVCDEMTSLFIAMARSLGIPARFVTGVSYTTHPAFDRNWQPHGWAEVYIPGVGWVPFDPAFKQFGYADATHIKLGDSLDPEQTATKFEWAGNADISPTELQFDVNITKKGTKSTQRVELHTEPLREELAFGSYNVIKTVVKNSRNQYATASLFISLPEELTADKKKQHIFLKPYEEKNVFWLVKVADGLEARYIYTLPVAISSEQNITSEIAFTSKEHGVFISRQQAEALMDEGKEEKTFIPNVGLNCTLAPLIILANESIAIECTVVNKGNTIVKELQLCSESRCKELTLYIADETKANFTVTKQKVGKFEHVIQLRNNELTKTLYLPYEVADKPIIAIEGIEIPAKVSFEDSFKLEFSMDKRSYALPQQITVKVSGGNINEAFRLENISYTHSFSIVSQAKYLREGENNIAISVNWQDMLGNNFNETIEVPITLGELTLAEKIENMVLRFGLWLKG